MLGACICCQSCAYYFDDNCFPDNERDEVVVQRVRNSMFALFRIARIIIRFPRQTQVRQDQLVLLYTIYGIWKVVGVKKQIHYKF